MDHPSLPIESVNETVKWMKSLVTVMDTSSDSLNEEETDAGTIAVMDNELL